MSPRQDNLTITTEQKATNVKFAVPAPNTYFTSLTWIESPAGPDKVQTQHSLRSCHASYQGHPGQPLSMAAVAALAQTITGAIVGSVTDTMVGCTANVTLVSSSTAGLRSAKSNENGDFVFNAVSGNHFMSGTDRFRTIDRPGLVLTATQRLAVGNMQMTVGEMKSVSQSRLRER
ncbi:MAG: hypothetical protein WKF37_21140 [Bryobacteraceae bacterium]